MHLTLPQLPARLPAVARIAAAGRGRGLAVGGQGFLSSFNPYRTAVLVSLHPVSPVFEGKFQRPRHLISILAQFLALGLQGFVVAETGHRIAPLPGHQLALPLWLWGGW